MSQPYKNVAVIGGSGNVGKPLVAELLAQGFNVTVISRLESTSTFPSGVTLKKVDFSSPTDLKAALEGQDAVVATVASAASGNQVPLIDAAVAAKVKRFIPSEFGIDTRVLGGTLIGEILGGKIAAGEYLKVKAAENEWFTWTGVSTGVFFDWGLNVGSIGFNKSTKTATIYDSGNTTFKASNLHLIAKVIAGVLSHPTETSNKYLQTSSFTISQNKVLEIVEKETNSKWNVIRVDTKDEQKAGEEKLAKADYFGAFGSLLRPVVYGDGQVGGEVKNDIDLIGLKEEDPVVTIKSWLNSA